MEKNLVVKVLVLIELASKFSKSEDDLFSDKSINSVNIGNSNGYVTMGGSNNKLVLNNKEIYVNTAGIVCAKDDKPKTRSEKMIEKTKAVAELSDEYDEYQKLTIELNEYFEALKKINE
jgi:hypothetical protein